MTVNRRERGRKSMKEMGQRAFQAEGTPAKQRHQGEDAMGTAAGLRARNGETEAGEGSEARKVAEAAF